MPFQSRIAARKFAMALLSGLAMTGCAAKKEIKAEIVAPTIVQPEVPPAGVPRKINPQSEVCRSCHAPGAAVQAKDLSSMYDHPKAHHPVSVGYPLSGQEAARYVPPNGRGADVAFFDRNGNGQRDADEVVLFGSGGEVTVECASCHIEHGSSQVTAKGSSVQYLRVSNERSALCTTCHRQ